MIVRDAMTSDVVTLLESESVLSGLKTLVRKALSGAPVLSRDGRLAGMVTEFDLLLAMIGDLSPADGRSNGPYRENIPSQSGSYVNPETDSGSRICLRLHTL